MKYTLTIALVFFYLNTIAQEGKIYFASTQTKSSRQNNVGVIDANGNNYQEVTFSVSTRSEYQPHVSGDGKRMTFNTYRYGGWKVAIANSDGSNVTKLTKSNNYEYDASWSPNGKQIILIGFESGNSGKRQLFLVNPNNQSKTRLTDGKYAHYSPSFISEDEILFSRITDGHYGIYTMNIGSKKVSKLVDSADYHEIAPRLSPDGNLLAYHRVNEENEIELVLHNMKTKTDKVIYSGWDDKEILSGWESPMFPFSVSWSPSGKELVFTSLLEPRNYELIRIDKNGENRKRLTFNRESDTQPHWVK